MIIAVKIFVPVDGLRGERRGRFGGDGANFGSLLSVCRRGG